MTLNSTTLIVVCAGCLIAACNADLAAVDAADYAGQNEQWRADRVERLKGPDGYLNLVGLYWLQAGNSSVGSAADNDIIFPDHAAARLGVLHLTETGVVFTAESGVDVRYEDIPVRSIFLADDTTDDPVTITHGSLVWTVIKRDERFALRLRDYEHPAIEAFPPIDYFPFDLTMRVSATLHRYDAPKILNVDTVIEGLGWQPESPGTVVFALDGQSYELEAYASGDELFFVFGDQTSGRETYPAGRFLYAALPEDGGTTIMDFNRAYNPPCAFNDFATCPVASSRNRLATRIEAGEKFDPNVHSTPGGYH